MDGKIRIMSESDPALAMSIAFSEQLLAALQTGTLTTWQAQNVVTNVAAHFCMQFKNPRTMATFIKSGVDASITYHSVKVGGTSKMAGSA